MDRSLDEVISERQKSNYRGRRNDRSNGYSRDGVRKTSQREYTRDLHNDWVHDRFEDDSTLRRPRAGGRDRPRTLDRYEPEDESPVETLGRIRVDNLHYDLTEDDLQELFTRIGPVTNCQILYDRSDRSRGIAYVTYASIRDAHRAIREYDGANAYKQPIKLTLQPTGPSADMRGGTARNPFDSVQLPGRSLFERINDAQGRGGPRERRRRSESPTRRSDVRKPPPEGIDRYVPAERRSGRSRSPLPRRGGEARRLGARLDERDRARSGRGRDRDGRPIVQGRPRKTATELDAEMEDYWGNKEAGDSTVHNGGSNGGVVKSDVAATEATLDDDIDMIE